MRVHPASSVEPDSSYQSNIERLPLVFGGTRTDRYDERSEGEVTERLMAQCVPGKQVELGEWSSADAEVSPETQLLAHADGTGLTGSYPNLSASATRLHATIS